VNDSASAAIVSGMREVLDCEAIGAITRLDPDHRIVVVLRYWADLTVEEIADRLDVPAGTVKPRNQGRAGQRKVAAVGAVLQRRSLRLWTTGLVRATLRAPCLWTVFSCS
jgi:hypothetical protein